jgi:hypothetical protein
VDPISIRVEFDGAAEAEDDITRVTRGLEDFEKKIGEAAGKTAAAADAVGRFATAVGNRTVADIARFTSELAKSAQAGAELGRMLGPGGAVVGGIAGGMLPAIERVIRATNEAAQAADRMSEAYRRAGEQARQALLQARQQADVAAGVFGSDTSDEDLSRLQSERAAAVTGLEREIARLDRSRRRDRVSEDSTTIPQLRQEMDAARRELAGIQAEIQRREATARAAQQQRDTAVISGLQEPESRRGGGESQADREAAAWERYQDALDAALEQQEAAKAAIEEQIALRQQAAEEFEEQEERKRELAAETLRLQVEAEAEALEEQKDKALEAAEQIADANEARLDAAREQVAGYKEVTDVIVGGLTDALASIADGSKTAEQAFLGLLAGFLKFIAEKAALSAAEEAAQAIAAYARYDFGSGAQHTAAAVAFGAVAIAAGAGSAAASSAASSAGRASEPERGRSQSNNDSGGGSVVVNFNAPVLSSDTRAQLGRQIQQLVTAGERYA